MLIYTLYIIVRREMSLLIQTMNCVLVSHLVCVMRGIFP